MIGPRRGDQMGDRLFGRRGVYSANVESVCLTAMQKDPRRRYANAGEFAAQLQRICATRPG